MLDPRRVVWQNEGMTRKHFEAIAAILADHHPVPGNDPDITFADTVYDLCNYFETVNPNFDRARFRKAAYNAKA